MNFFSFFLYFTSKAKKCYSKNVKGRVFGVYLFSYANNGMVQTSLRSPAVHWDRFCLITLTTIQLTLFSFILCNVLDYWYIWLSSFFSKPHIFYFLLHCHGLSVQDYLYLCRREFVIWLSIMTLRASWLYIFFFLKTWDHILILTVWSAKSVLFYNCVYCLAVPRHSCLLSELKLAIRCTCKVTRWCLDHNV